MKVGVISNNDLCLPFIFFLIHQKAEVRLYFGASSTVDPRREEVQRFCNSYELPYIDATRADQTVYEWVNAFEPELVFVIGHRQKINLNKAKASHGIYNIHFGKLPQYRGGSPLFWQMKKMEQSLGCSIHLLTSEMDAGPVCWQREIRNEEYFSHNYVQYLFSNLIVEGVNDIIQKVATSSLQPIPQDESLACWYAKPSLIDVLIRWDQMSAYEICSLVRACNTWNTGAITLYQGMEVKIIDASHSRNNSTEEKDAGTIDSINGSIKVRCIQNEEVEIHYLSINGIPFPGRHARHYGILEGQRLTYSSD